jgi:hypothetical protein
MATGRGVAYGEPTRTGERARNHSASRPEGNAGPRPPLPYGLAHCARTDVPLRREHLVTVQGTIERFTFRNPDTGWAVVRLVDEATGAP